MATSRYKHALILGLSALTFSFTSCTTLFPVKDTPAAPVVKVQSPQWYKVSSNPPSYFPKGLSKHAETSAYHGFWVNGGDGSMWFVPKNGINGLSAAQLKADALSKAPAPPKTKKVAAVTKTLKSATSTAGSSVSKAYTGSAAWTKKSVSNAYQGTKNSTGKAYKNTAAWTKNSASKTYTGTKNLAKKAVFWR